MTPSAFYASTCIVTLCLQGNFACYFVVCCTFSQKSAFSKIPCRITIRVSNSLDPDQDFVGPELGPNCCKYYWQTTLVGNAVCNCRIRSLILGQVWFLIVSISDLCPLSFICTLRQTDYVKVVHYLRTHGYDSRSLELRSARQRNPIRMTFR